MKNIVLISCVSKKQDIAPEVTVKAEELYISPLFKYALNYAKTLSDEIYILSAKHHVLSLDTLITAYNVTLNRKKSNERKTWAQTVLSQLKSKGIDITTDHFTILAGKVYYKDIIGAGKIENYKLEYQGLKGIGYILHYLKDKTSH